MISLITVHFYKHTLNKVNIGTCRILPNQEKSPRTKRSVFPTHLKATPLLLLQTQTGWRTLTNPHRAGDADNLFWGGEDRPAAL